MSQQVTDDDWRLQGQERYLSGATLYWRVWHGTRAGWDHDHCEFCFTKFMDRADVPDVLGEGYTTDDEYRWVCAKCAADFAARFKFKFVGGPAATRKRKWRARADATERFLNIETWSGLMRTAMDPNGKHFLLPLTQMKLYWVRQLLIH
jgi:hypothetical protein